MLWRHWAQSFWVLTLGPRLVVLVPSLTGGLPDGHKPTHSVADKILFKHTVTRGTMHVLRCTKRCGDQCLDSQPSGCYNCKLVPPYHQKNAVATSKTYISTDVGT